MCIRDRDRPVLRHSFDLLLVRLLDIIHRFGSAVPDTESHRAEPHEEVDDGAARDGANGGAGRSGGGPTAGLREHDPLMALVGGTPLSHEFPHLGLAIQVPLGSAESLTRGLDHLRVIVAPSFHPATTELLVAADGPADVQTVFDRVPHRTVGLNPGRPDGLTLMLDDRSFYRLRLVLDEAQIRPADSRFGAHEFRDVEVGLGVRGGGVNSH